jgi:hypothetical protein
LQIVRPELIRHVRSCDNTAGEEGNEDRRFPLPGSGLANGLSNFDFLGHRNVQIRFIEFVIPSPRRLSAPNE